MYNMIGQIVSGLSQTVGSVVNTRQTNESNYKIAQETNKANRELVELQNKAAAEQSELAYNRSKATNQVNLMQQAGMSRAGAINALNGGGSYTPAPVNVSQDSAPQMQTTDLSGLANIAQAFAQRSQQKHDAAMQEKQLQEQKRQFNEQLNFEKQKWNDEAAKRGQELDNLVKQGVVLDNTAKKLGFETNIAETNSEILSLLKEDEISTEKAELLARKLRAQNEKYIENVRSKGLKSLSPEAFQQLINNVTEREAIATTLEMFQTYAKDKGWKVGKKLLKEFIEQSIIKGAPLTNAVL